MDPDAIDLVVRKYAGKLGLDPGYSAHSMRATFITTRWRAAQGRTERQAPGSGRDEPTRARRSYMIRAGATRRKLRRFLLRIDVCTSG
jgi:hypothetical protein